MADFKESLIVCGKVGVIMGDFSNIPTVCDAFLLLCK